MVTLVRTGAVYVQKDPVHVDADGTFSGEARFEDVPLTEDDELEMQVVATSSVIPAGKLNQVRLPDDAIFSESVAVRWVQWLVGQIEITTPTDGAEVALNDRILGRTSYPDFNHYIVVTPVKTSNSSVQDRPATVNRSDGTFAGTVRFGGVEVGGGEQFVVRIVATKSTLSAGALITQPSDTISSNAVTVTRRK